MTSIELKMTFKDMYLLTDVIQWLEDTVDTDNEDDKVGEMLLDALLGAKASILSQTPQKEPQKELLVF